MPEILKMYRIKFQKCVKNYFLNINTFINYTVGKYTSGLKYQWANISMGKSTSGLMFQWAKVPVGKCQWAYVEWAKASWANVPNPCVHICFLSLILCVTYYVFLT